MGFLYWKELAELKQAILAGEYGQAFRDAYVSCELSVLVSDALVFECPACKHWDVECAVALWEPKGAYADKLRKQLKKRKWEDIAPTPIRYMLNSNRNRKAFEYVPSCPDCGTSMVLGPTLGDDTPDIHKLKCPQRGHYNANPDVPFGCWD